MNLTRLMVLATLARHGPRHGHEIRRLAEVTNVGEWGGVSVGALYRELRTMEGEGLVDPVRTEQVGRRPARTVYAITRAGWVEFAMLRERAVRSVRWGPDELGVALTFAGPGPDRDELITWLNARREAMAASAAMLADERGRLTAKGYLDPFSAAVMYRSQLHAETEVRWHDEFAKILAGLPEQDVEWAEVPSGSDFRAQVSGIASTADANAGTAGTGTAGTGTAGTGDAGTGHPGTGAAGTGEERDIT